MVENSGNSSLSENHTFLKKNSLTQSLSELRQARYFFLV
ncbi:hypothetical protein LEP1GSC052_2046 [Leptospira kmetyi serovar Malaysia str. Bejo-Iso9]|nr:hypothetical protein LEP1GSC052_2046 [Leptospira kmetyi serovar Malaysia str. Bejo-Iso9]